MAKMTSRRSSARIAEKYKADSFMDIRNSLPNNHITSDDEEYSDCGSSQCSTPRKTKLKSSQCGVTPPKLTKLGTPSGNQKTTKSTTNTPSLEKLSLISPTKNRSVTRKSLFKENDGSKRSVVKTISKNIEIESSSSEDSDERVVVPKSKTNGIKIETSSEDSEEEREVIPKRKTNRIKIETVSSSEDSEEERKVPKSKTPLRSQKATKSSVSPSLERLSLISPNKSKSVNGKRVFKENAGSKQSIVKNISKNTSKIVDTSSSEDLEEEKEVVKNKTVYQCARQALHGTFPTEMPGREKELEQLKNFLKENIRNKTSGSLYVSGPPGTGKTASLNTILLDTSWNLKFTSVYVNCTAIKSPTAIYSRIVKELNLKLNGKTEKDHVAQICSYLRKKHKPTLLILDEIDQLETKNQSILYTIFEWPSRPNSQLLLIGIANALDLTDRILPRLQSRCELKPQLLHFAPYTRSQIIDIFTCRLKSAGVLEIFSPAAVQMLAGKIAAVSGDVRRALDIGRRVIELADHSRKTGALKSVENLANQLVEDEIKAVDLKQVLNVLNNVYGTSQNLSDNIEESFPLQQKITVCSLLLMLKKGKNKDITVGKLHEVYRKVCDKRKIGSVDQAEFVGLCSLIETRGMLSITGRKEPRLHKISLVWDEGEVTAALKDKQLISEILQDESCLNRF